MWWTAAPRIELILVSCDTYHTGPGGDGNRVLLPRLLSPELHHHDGRGAGPLAGGGGRPAGGYNFMNF